MTRAAELLAQYQSKIDKAGQWIAVRRYVGTAGVRTFTDTLAKAYMSYQPAKEFVGSTIQNYAVVIALAEPFIGWNPQINTNDKLVTGEFTGFDDLTATPPLDGDSHVSGRSKESAIFSIEKRQVSGKWIALEFSAVG
jgi:hypothetical protein